MNKEEKVPYTPFIEGETIDLVAGSSEHAKLYAKWNNDPEVRKYMRNTFPTSIDDTKNWFKPREHHEMRDWVVFDIWHKQDKKLIGSGGLNRIDYTNRNANIFVKVGEKDYWGKGVATETARLLFDYAFKELNLHKVYARYHAPNIGSQIVADKKLGLIKEGVHREEVYIDGKYHDVHYYGVLKKDWLEQEDK